MAKTNKNRLVSPFLKWVGGKRQLIPAIVENLPKGIKNLKYYEPFIGGGAVLFHLQPKNAVINDLNEELINVYRVIKNDLEALINDLRIHKNNADYFYEIRGLDRTDDFNKLSAVQKASRVIYLNKTCYNGLYRVNNAGEFNAPFGRYKNPNIVNEPTLKAVNKFLNSSNIIINCDDYEKVLEKADNNSFVYIDPPYHPISESSNFTGYVQGGWNMYDQVRLRDNCDKLNERGVKLLISNSSASFIKDIYENYKIINVKATRYINSNASGRGEIDEVLIKNYE
ncbi:MAG TPA: DNA adenine methylase [Bacteroidales bacterium]|jgi:DNA adenine methylase|nr:DNA adenine methylase [Bacteroidales bacterium]MDD4150773.1 DNA adenine methylase [Bacteroidales bacterium]HXK82062.1 DNA adenine methylase [Bacteroidales bacterium]